ncbi:dynamin family protein (plasmid) [Novosphingobium aerophilum]|uniref:dynamin family protein n=1 Tax=Novosphingobium aerophilum TaxID=2839843 RepID=UPI003FD6A20D
MTLLQAYDLAKMRVDAKISQGEMAARLGVSQSQVSRYEQDPDNTPLGVVKNWVMYCGDIAMKQGLEYGAPYRNLAAQIQLMSDYAETAPAPLDEALFKSPPTAANFLREVRNLGRKPRVAICGRFDQGKSRLANTLMGGDALPASYQPATAIISLVRHISDRPSWIKEDVWIMRQGFQLNQADDEQHCNEHKVVAGSFDTLKMYGTHSVNPPADADQCFAALVYVDSPFLLGCDLLDLPGYGHSQDDHSKAELAQSLADILIYVSAAQGFMDQQDLQFANALLKNLPIIEGKDDALPVLRNVYFVATMARQDQAELEDIISKASSRAYKHLLEVLEARCVLIGRQICLTDFRARFFTYLVDDSNRRTAFEEDLVNLLGAVCPVQKRSSLNSSVVQLKNAAKTYCDGWMSNLSGAFKNRERAQASLELLERAEPLRRRRIGSKTDRIQQTIESNKSASSEYIKDDLSKLVTPDYVEACIRERYEDKKDGQQLAGSYIVGHIQNMLNSFLEDRSQELVTDIDDILADYQTEGTASDGIELSEISVQFNAKAVFLGALAATGTATGAMAAWAVATAASAEVGSAILLPGVASYLAGIGATAGGMLGSGGLIAALGGPLALFFGLAVGLGLIAYTLFGASWQSRLAKKICEALKEQNFLPTLTKCSEEYWDATSDSFQKCMAKTEAAYQENLSNLRNLVDATSQDKVDAMISEVEATRDFFAGIPWKLAS